MVLGCFGSSVWVNLVGRGRGISVRSSLLGVVRSKIGMQKIECGLSGRVPYWPNSENRMTLVTSKNNTEPSKTPLRCEDVLTLFLFVPSNALVFAALFLIFILFSLFSALCSVKNFN